MYSTQSPKVTIVLKNHERFSSHCCHLSNDCVRKVLIAMILPTAVQLAFLEEDVHVFKNLIF